MFTPEVMKYGSHIKNTFCGFPFYNVEKKNECLANIVRNNGAFVP